MRLRYATAILAIAIAAATFGSSRAYAGSLRQGVPAYPGLVNRRLPDGRIIQVRQHGDEAYHWMETADGYTVEFDKATGNFEYLVVDAQGRFQPTGRMVGRDDPAAVGILRGAHESQTVILEKRRVMERIKRAAGGAITKAALPTSGNVPLLVILANYSDTTTATLPSDFDLLFNGNATTTPPVTSSVRIYYDEVSYGKVNIQATIVGWVTVPSPRAAYGADQGPVIDVNPRQLIRDAINEAYRLGVNFAPFDTNGDGILELVVVIHAGTGQEESGDPDDIWSHSWNLLFPYPVDSVSTTPGTLGLFAMDYVTMPEVDMAGNIATIGVFCHELGHAFGLPDLYDYGYDSEGVGDWCLMAGGSWNGLQRPGDSPAHLSAWCKHFLKWLNLTTANGMIVTAKRLAAPLPPVESDPVAYIVCMGNNPTTSTEYLMIENRQWIGYDQALPNYGMLAWHVDETVPNNDDQTHYHVALIQADGLKDLESNVNRGDVGDPFPGYSVARTLAPYSDNHDGDPIVNTNSYYLPAGAVSLGRSDTNIWFMNISNPLINMTVDIRFLPNLFVNPVSAITLQSVRAPIVFRNGSQREVFAPGDPLRYTVSMGNRDDNWPFARLCEDTTPYWVELWGSITGGLTLDYYIADSVRRTPGLAANATASVTGSGPIYSLPDGSYSMAVTLDRLNEVQESAKADNRWAVPQNKVLILRPPSGADLVVHDFTFGPNWASEGEALQLGGRVVNEGANDSGAFWIEFWGSFDAPDKYYPTLDFFVCNSVYVATLAAGGTFDLASVSRTLDAVPSHALTQTFSVGCVVDRTDLVNETNETNNHEFVSPVNLATLGATVPAGANRAPVKAVGVAAAASRPAPERVVPKPNPNPADLGTQPELTVRQSTCTISGLFPPRDLSVQLTVHNWGLVTALPNWSHVYVSRDSVLSADDFLWLQGIRNPVLPTGAEVTTWILTTSPAMSPGVYRLLGQVDVLDEISEADETNNVFDAGRFLVGPDLELVFNATTITLSGQPAPLDLQVNVMLHNAGLTTATASWVHIYVSTDEFLSPDDYLWVQGIRIPPMPGQTTYQTQIPVGAPPLPLGAYHMIAQCDVVNEVAEAIEDNNVLYCGPVIVGPDLTFETAGFTELQPNVVSSLGVQFSEPGTSLGVVLRVVNRGILPANPYWLELWGSRTGGLTLDEFLTESRYVYTGMGPLSRLDINDEWRLNSFRDGPYTIMPVLDRLNSVVEVYEKNNRAPVAAKRLVEIRAIRGINLRIPEFRFAPNPIRPGAQLKFNGSVVNAGDEHSGPFWIEFWLSTSQGIPTPDFALCDSIFIPNLRPGQQVFLLPYERTVYWNVPLGDCTVMCVVDRPDQISEYDETDNYVLVSGIKVMP